MNNDFKTQIDLDLLIDRNDNYDIETKKFNLRWNVEFEVRQYGIKSVNITVPEQKIELDICVWGDNEDTYETLTLDIKDVVIERNTEGFDNLVPQSLSYFKNKWTLVF